MQEGVEPGWAGEFVLGKHLECHTMVPNTECKPLLTRVRAAHEA